MVYLIHGVISEWSKERISHSLLIPEQQFANHLEHRPTKYVSLTQALTGRGDALTIDDATRAGFHAALLARHHGHAVTWFINGSHVKFASPYFPFQLSCMLDTVLLDSCFFSGKYWDLRTEGARRVLRLYLKQQYMRMNSVKEIEGLLSTLSQCFELGPECIEQALRTVTMSDLQRASAAGVALQNHGWTHINPKMLTAREQNEDIERNEEYLGHLRTAENRIYAPPFGGHTGVWTMNSDFILLADRSLSAHHSRDKIVNRGELRLSDSSVHLATTSFSASLSPAA